MEKLTAISFAKCLLVLIGISLITACAKKTESGTECRTCTATYSTGSVAGGPTEVCSDEAEASFRSEYDYADKIECK